MFLVVGVLFMVEVLLVVIVPVGLIATGSVEGFFFIGSTGWLGTLPLFFFSYS